MPYDAIRRENLASTSESVIAQTAKSLGVDPRNLETNLILKRAVADVAAIDLYMKESRKAVIANAAPNARFKAHKDGARSMDFVAMLSTAKELQTRKADSIDSEALQPILARIDIRNSLIVAIAHVFQAARDSMTQVVSNLVNAQANIQQSLNAAPGANGITVQHLLNQANQAVLNYQAAQTVAAIHEEVHTTAPTPKPTKGGSAIQRDQDLTRQLEDTFQGIKDSLQGPSFERRVIEQHELFIRSFEAETQASFARTVFTNPESPIGRQAATLSTLMQSMTSLRELQTLTVTFHGDVSRRNLSDFNTLFRELGYSLAPAPQPLGNEKESQPSQAPQLDSSKSISIKG